MATILTGKHKGKQIKISKYYDKWCNLSMGVNSITDLKFTVKEALQIAMYDDSAFIFEQFRLIGKDGGYQFIRRD